MKYSLYYTLNSNDNGVVITPEHKQSIISQISTIKKHETCSALLLLIAEHYYSKINGDYTSIPYNAVVTGGNNGGNSGSNCVTVIDDTLFDDNLFLILDKFLKLTCATS